MEDASSIEILAYPSPAVSQLTRLRGAVGRLVPGVAMATAIAVGATFLGRLAPVVGAPVIAIVAGIVISALRSPAASARIGLDFTAKRVLQASIVVLGLNLSLHQVLVTGAASLPVLAGTLVGALAGAYFIGRRLKLHRDLATLIGVGTAICGASAIAATEAVIDAEDADVAYAIATIFTFNVVAVLLYPTLGHLMGLSQHAFGLWAGTAINDVSSVVAASSVYGHAATAYAVVVKLARTLALLPIAFVLSALRRRGGANSALEPALAREQRRGQLRKAVPTFLFVFVAAVIVNTAGLIPLHWHGPLDNLATWMITAALAAIGLSTRFRDLRRTGPRPMVLGAALWAIVGVTSLLLQLATGTI